MTTKKRDIGDTKDSLQDVMNELNKKHEGSQISFVNKENSVDVEATPTGCFSLDHVFGCGGMPKGRVLEVFGEESSGKSTLALYIASQVQKAGGIVAFIDAEFSFTRKYAEDLGIKCDDLILSQPSSGEDAFDIIDKLAKTGEVDLIIVDSVAALTPEAEIEGEIGDANIALQARLLSKGLRVLTSTLGKTNTTILFINQMRSNVQSYGYGPKKTTTGGKALKFYSSVRLEVKKLKTLKDSKDVAYGTVIGVSAVKNKVAAPFRTAQLEIVFGKGINVKADEFEAALLADLITKKGNTYYYGEEKLAVGKNNAIIALSENDKIYAEVRKGLENSVT